MKYIRDLQIAVQEPSRRVLMIDHRDAARELRYITDWIASQALLDAIFATAARIEPNLDFAAWEQQLRNYTLAWWPNNTEAGKAWLARGLRVGHGAQHLPRARATGRSCAAPRIQRSSVKVSDHARDDHARDIDRSLATAYRGRGRGVSSAAGPSLLRPCRSCHRGDVIVTRRRS